MVDPQEFTDSLVHDTKEEGQPLPVTQPAVASQKTLLGLPVEIRLQIFQYLLTSSTIKVSRIRPNGVGRTTQGAPEPTVTTLEDGTMTWGVLRTCKRFYLEAKPLIKFQKLVLERTTLFPLVGGVHHTHMETIEDLEITEAEARLTYPYYFKSLASFKRVKVMGVQLVANVRATRTAQFYEYVVHHARSVVGRPGIFYSWARDWRVRAGQLEPGDIEDHITPDIELTYCARRAPSFRGTNTTLPLTTRAVEITWSEMGTRVTSRWVD